MRLDKTSTIGGLPILKTRDFFKRHLRWDLNVQAVMKVFTFNARQAKHYVDELHQRGLIERMTEDTFGRAYDAKEAWYRLSDLGRSLALARAVPPMKREKATALLNELLGRVHAANQSTVFTYTITKVVVFGSYLNADVNELSDLDIGVTITPKYGTQQGQKNMEYLRYVHNQGRSIPSDTLGQFSLARRDVLTFLKNRSRYLSLHTEEDEVLQLTRTKQVFPVNELTN
ncbi:nucleotidyltransferase domain-containing protein [Spirosoma areae]